MFERVLVSYDFPYDVSADMVRERDLTSFVGNQIWGFSEVGCTGVKIQCPMSSKKLYVFLLLHTKHFIVTYFKSE